MSSVHTPQGKKGLAYERDHYAKSEYDKARNGRRIKKRKKRRSYRHAADSLTKAAASDGEADARIAAIIQKPLGKWPVPTLRAIVARKLERRTRSVGAKKRRKVSRSAVGS